MIRTARITLTVLAALATLAIFTPGNAAKPYNQSSHPPEFFRDLLAGKVFIYKAYDHPAAYYFTNKGAIRACWYSSKKRHYVTGFSTPTWSIGTPAGPSNYEMHWTTSTGEPRYRRRVIIYTPDTGQLHLESLSPKTKVWTVSQRGWLQHAWPKALANPCAHIGLPYTLPIDEYQDTLSFEHMKANASPVKNYPSSEIRYPGATGIGAAGNKPTTTPEQFHATIRAFHGYVLKSSKGRWLLFNALPDRLESWLLDSERDIIDAGTASLTNNGTLLTTDWDMLEIQHDLHVGYPIPLLSTGQLHPAFAMMKDLADSARPVALPGDLAHVFRAGGTVSAGDSKGTWHISRGAIHIDIAGTSRAISWREFADIAGWKQ